MARPSRGPDDHVKCRISDEVLPIVQLLVVFCQFLHQVAPVCNYVVDFRGAVWAALGPKAIFMPSYMARMFQQSVVYALTETQPIVVGETVSVPLGIDFLAFLSAVR